MHPKYPQFVLYSIFITDCQKLDGPAIRRNDTKETGRFQNLPGLQLLRGQF